LSKTIISWNVNGIRAAEKKGLYEWLQTESPDILCLQETKAQEEQLGEKFFKQKGYIPYFMSAEKKGYSGVAVYTKGKPISIRNLNIEEFDNEGRTIVLEYKNFTLINCYFPNSQSEGKRLGYKTGFNEAVHSLCKTLVKEGKNIVLCGDYNVAHKAIDLTHPKANVKNPGYLPEEREWMDKFIDSGYVDTFRMFNTEPENYSWWSYRTNAREKNAGWRIDYFCVNKEFKKKVKSADILKHVMGSDHCPVQVVLK